MSAPIRTSKIDPKILELVKQIQAQPHVIIAEKCRRSFYLFVQEFWETIIPDEPVWNWHMEFLCDELQKLAWQVMNNEDKEHDLIINIPPGTTKSTIVTVMFPAWCWVARHPYIKDMTGKHLRFITTSYSSPLSLEHADLSRDVIRSDKYLLYFPGTRIRRDKEQKSNFKLKDGGNRFSTSVGGSVTGVHGHFILIDDPLNPKEAISEVERKGANGWIDSTLSTRKVNKKVTVTILIMQRLHEDDPTGNMLAKQKEGKRIKHICLPGKLVSDSGKELKVSPPELREKYIDGYLDSERLPQSVLDEMRADLGKYGYAGQVEQYPVPPEGGMFKVDKFIIEKSLPSKPVKIVRYWDKAGTDAKDRNAKACTVGVQMCRMKDGRFAIMDVVRGQWESYVREKTIKQTTKIDGLSTIVYVEQEPGSGGKESAQGTIRNLAGYRVHADRPTGDKVFRADPYSVQVNAGNVVLIRGDWNRPYIEEHRHFPVSTTKDQVDGSSGAFSKLVSSKRAGAW